MPIHGNEIESDPRVDKAKVHPSYSIVHQDNTNENVSLTFLTCLQVKRMKNLCAYCNWNQKLSAQR